ncbi:family 10 glycosylhydrolase [Streptomyces sp. B-S-A8]|uniref:Family 10 glycosylhydrolase n=1 Tax=Streptomyces solicavernae TaxID=3043614 RepID=A0ABT6RQX0_9ACTN|nr:family 10 glycosylhydrolase [Streptomyces sp. B-S-A8]MDI3386837.1 family 10 glycosylhydrolase [Streptomyces sp. B-S-A8]
MDIGRRRRHSVRISRRALGVAAAALVSGLATDAQAVAQGRGRPGKAAGQGGRHGAEGEAAGQGGRHGADGVRRELRGMWLASVANRDWPSRPGLSPAAQRAELLAYLDAAVARRLNTVIFQARPSADALWPSPYEPWSEFLTGVQGRDPGWDPLGTAVEEAHRRGLELHVWCNPYRVAIHTDLSRLDPAHPARVHPDWVVPYGGKLYYNPGLPQVRRFVQDAMLDAVRRYPVDAMHWDDYFYPYPVAGEVFDDDAAYARYGGAFPDRASWRRHNTDLLVREMAARLPQVRRGVRFGVSPFGVWRNASTDPRGSDTAAGVQTYDDLYADTRTWVRQGWIDYVVPQLYWNIGFPAADYARLLPWWAEVARGARVQLYLGEALYKAGDPAQPAPWQDSAELSRHLTLACGFAEVRGHAFFSAKEVALDPSGAMARVVADHYARSPRR